MDSNRVDKSHGSYDALNCRDETWNIYANTDSNRVALGLKKVKNPMEIKGSLRTCHCEGDKNDKKQKQCHCEIDDSCSESCTGPRTTHETLSEIEGGWALWGREIDGNENPLPLQFIPCHSENDPKDCGHYVCDVYFKMNKKFDFSGSIFFAMQVLTTIGYGAYVPDTDEGKVACLIYSLIGISVTSYFLGLIAELMFRCAKESFYDAEGDDTPKDIDAGFTIMVVWTCVVFVLGTIIYYVWEEDWSVFDAVWFLWVSFSTVGFGDFVPNNQSARWFSCVFLMLGLAAVGHILGALGDQMSEYVEVLARCLGILDENETDEGVVEKDKNETLVIKSA